MEWSWPLSRRATHNKPGQFCNLSVALFVVTFVLTIPLYHSFNEYKHDVSRNWLLATVNHVFVADYGYLWFTLIYFGWLFTYQKDWRIPTDKVVRFLVYYGINTLFCLVVNVWFFGPSVFERINAATGGHCESRPFLTEKQCAEDGGHWISGFDGSGHYYLISSMSLLVVHELWWVDKPDNIEATEIVRADEEANSPEAGSTGTSSYMLQSRFHSFLIVITLFILVMWYWMFVITSIFFHTIPERLVGLITGLIVPFILTL